MRIRKTYLPITILAGSLVAMTPLAARAQLSAPSSRLSYSASDDTAPLSVDQATDLQPGEYLWHPDASVVGDVNIVVNVAQQVAYVYRGDTLIGISTVSTGRDGHLTPIGDFTILQKQVDHHSNLYHEASMPYMERLTWDGVALHAGGVPGYRESHGCVHLPVAFAKALYKVTDLGASVHIIDPTQQDDQDLGPATTIASADDDSSIAVQPIALVRPSAP